MCWRLLRSTWGAHCRLIDNPPMRCGSVVAFRGPMGWLPNRLPTACGVALERGAGLSGLAVVWLERGVSASPRNQTCPPRFFYFPEDKERSWQ
jgi:hypothetical protein